MEKAIIVQDVTKEYKLYNDTKERLFDLLTPKRYGESFYALAGVHFEANVGEVVGFIGVNGSGKSTLSNIIAGIVPETSGTVQVNGQASLIAVAAGLNNDLTGRDNIELKLLMLGFNREEINELEDDIIEFSELEKFIDQPVKSYSSGMKSRLGFAISVNIDPDILIIDEALSVGDRAFADKSLEKMNEFKREGKTMIFVSHSIRQVQQFCDKILWLEYGMVKDYGTAEEVIPKYEKFLDVWKKMSKKERDEYRKKALEQQQYILAGTKETYSLDVNKFVKKKDKPTYRERPISLLGKVENTNASVYEHPKHRKEKDLLSNYTEQVLFIKKQATVNKEKFYLISIKPSTIHGVIGWAKASDLKVHRHTLIDKDTKQFEIIGTGSAYNKPWGGRRNRINKKLADFKGETFQVKRTDIVGKSIWYNGTLENEDVWIRHRHIERRDEYRP